MTIKLKGWIGEKYGSEYKLQVATIAEGIRALCRQLKGFEEDVGKMGDFYRCVRTYRGGEEAYDASGLDRLHMRLGNSTGFSLEPVIGGAGGRGAGIGKIVAGVLLIGAAFFFAPAAGLGATAFSIGGAGITYSQIALFGGLLLLAGASSLMSQVEEENTDDKERPQSYTLDTPRNLVEQGHPVPIGYGECFTGSLVISTGLVAEEMG